MTPPVPDEYRLDGPPYRTRPNLIQPARRVSDDAPVVLKVHAGDEYFAELTALRHYNAFPVGSFARVVRLLDHDDARQTLVLERIAGQRLDHEWPNARADTDTTAVLARTMAELWLTPLPDAGAVGWWQLRDYISALERPAPPGVDAEELARAAALARELRAEPENAVVVHGDLHHENVLIEPAGTAAVLDPKGLTGAPGFDVAALLGNPLGRLAEAGNVASLLAGRVHVLAAELGRERQWVSAWGWVGAVLGAVWSAESAQFPADHLAVAAVLRTLS